MAQKEGDASFGTVALTLAVGTYQLVVIVHNCDGSFRLTAVPDWDSVNGYTF